MHLDITWHGETTSVDLADGAVTIGGAAEDGIFLHGLEPALLTLTIDGAKCTLKARKTLRVGAAMFPAHVGRLLVEGEELRLPNDVLVQRPVDAKRAQVRKEISTAFLAKEMMGALIPPVDTRAASLVCVAGNDVGRRHPLAGTECTLGRGTDVDVRLHDRSVSRHHARIVRRGREYLVEDLGTTNGVYLNGLRVKGFRTLATGDVLELGQTMLRYEGAERSTGEDTVLAPPEAPAVTEKEMPRVTVVDRPGDAPPGAFRATRSDVPRRDDDFDVDVNIDLGGLSPSGMLAVDEVQAAQQFRRPNFEVLLMGAGVSLAALGASVAAMMLR